MDLMEVLDQVRALLRSKGRLTYRLLKAQFQLDEESLAALKEELLEGEQVARDENGKVLVWVGEGAVLVPSPQSLPPPA
jgi:hypothetical protein